MIDNTKKIIAISIVAILIIGVAIMVAFNEKNNKDTYGWQEWANQVNECTDYYLDNETYGPCGYIKTIGSDYSTTLSVGLGYNGTISYCKAHTNDKGIVLEWYKKSTDGIVTHTSTTYIPFDAICYAQSNQVNL